MLCNLHHVSRMWQDHSLYLGIQLTLRIMTTTCLTLEDAHRIVPLLQHWDAVLSTP